MTIPETLPKASEANARFDLAAARKAKGLTLDEIASATLIGVHYLAAIEAEEFAKLPARVYALSYIRQYCRAVGYDEAAALARYCAQRASEPPASSSRRGLPWLPWRPHYTL
jgi:cytoskeletal protein RodZ